MSNKIEMKIQYILTYSALQPLFEYVVHFLCCWVYFPNERLTKGVISLSIFG